MCRTVPVPTCNNSLCMQGTHRLVCYGMIAMLSLGAGQLSVVCAVAVHSATVCRADLRLAHVVQYLHSVLPGAQLSIGCQQGDIGHDVGLQACCVHVIKHLLYLHITRRQSEIGSCLRIKSLAVDQNPGSCFRMKSLAVDQSSEQCS